MPSSSHFLVVSLKYSGHSLFQAFAIWFMKRWWLYNCIVCGQLRGFHNSNVIKIKLEQVGSQNGGVQYRQPSGKVACCFPNGWTVRCKNVWKCLATLSCWLVGGLSRHNSINRQTREKPTFYWCCGQKATEVADSDSSCWWHNSSNDTGWPKLMKTKVCQANS